jgi:hypothetical protein
MTPVSQGNKRVPTYTSATGPNYSGGSSSKKTFCFFRERLSRMGLAKNAALARSWIREGLELLARSEAGSRTGAKS